MQMVFQDPFASLNPRLRVGEIIGEGMRALGTAGSSASPRVGELLEKVGLRAEMAPAIRTSSPAASASALPSPVRWR
jgi:ABC-type microcin C transport system duplicated ATPase subunit YejF